MAIVRLMPAATWTGPVGTTGAITTAFSIEKLAKHILDIAEKLIGLIIAATGTSSAGRLLTAAEKVAEQSAEAAEAATALHQAAHETTHEAATTSAAKYTAGAASH